MNENDIARFWSKVDQRRPDECWLWQGAKASGGYGSFKANGKALRAHRIAFLIAFGVDPEGLLVCHHCDRPGCVNPRHLFLGTPRDNARDRHAKGRTRIEVVAGERHGMAKLTSEHVRAIRALVSSGASRREVAAQFGISQSGVSRVVTSSRWAHVPEKEADMSATWK